MNPDREASRSLGDAPTAVATTALAAFPDDLEGHERARIIGPWLLGDAIASGHVATLHLARHLEGASASAAIVQRVHPGLAGRSGLAARLDELAAIVLSVDSPHLVAIRDVSEASGEVLIVLDPLEGLTLAKLSALATQQRRRIPPHIAATIIVSVLRGLHVGHEATSTGSAPCDLLHRSLSPRSILIGVDGVVRVLSFGLTGAVRATDDETETLARDDNDLLAYMAPEQLCGTSVDRRADLFAAGVVLWELLAGERLFGASGDAALAQSLTRRDPPLLAERDLGIGIDVDEVLARSLASDTDRRFDTADEMARALEDAVAPTSDLELAIWLEGLGAPDLQAHRAQGAILETLALAAGRHAAVIGVGAAATAGPAAVSAAEPLTTVAARRLSPAEVTAILQTPMAVVADAGPPSGGATRVAPVECRARAAGARGLVGASLARGKGHHLPPGQARPLGAALTWWKRRSTQGLSAGLASAVVVIALVSLFSEKPGPGVASGGTAEAPSRETYGTTAETTPRVHDPGPAWEAKARRDDATPSVSRSSTTPAMSVRAAGPPRSRPHHVRSKPTPPVLVAR